MRCTEKYSGGDWIPNNGLGHTSISDTPFSVKYGFSYLSPFRSESAYICRLDLCPKQSYSVSAPQWVKLDWLTQSANPYPTHPIRSLG
jgi:hypothetical protein